MWLVCVPAGYLAGTFFLKETTNEHEQTRRFFFIFRTGKEQKAKKKKHLCSSATSAAKNSRELPLALFSFLKNGFRCGDVDVSAPKSFS